VKGLVKSNSEYFWREQLPAELVTAASQGEGSAWAELVRRFEGLVFSTTLSYGFRSESESADICQTVWLQLAQNLCRLREPDRVSAWLLKTTHRECTRVKNSKARTVPFDVVDYLLPSVESLEPLSTRIETEERNFALWEAFLRLPTKCQSLLRLLIEDPRPGYQQIAQLCGVAVGAIGPRRQRCLSTLRVALQEHPAIV
jgi:RNA polymerase sigma factor (sigma-70 family)